MTLVPVLSGAVGVALGATLQYWFGQRAEAKRHRRERRADAYAEFLRAIACAALARTEGARTEALRDFAAAKARIAVYGSQSVVASIVKFERAGAIVGTTEGAAALLHVCQTMRDEQGREDTDVASTDLEVLLLGPQKGAATSTRALPGRGEP